MACTVGWTMDVSATGGFPEGAPAGSSVLAGADSASFGVPPAWLVGLPAGTGVDMGGGRVAHASSRFYLLRCETHQQHIKGGGGGLPPSFSTTTGRTTIKSIATPSFLLPTSL